MKPAALFITALSLLSPKVLAEACLITSADQGVPIQLCQANISIPSALFTQSFCQPQIPDREFTVSMLEECPAGAYGICSGAHTEGVGYQQSIHYYSEAGDAPILKAYCEDISQGRWIMAD